MRGATHSQDIHINFDGRVVDFDERFFIVRVDSATASTANLTDLEREVLVGHRWWTRDELLATDEALSPFPVAEQSCRS